jgi:DNA glycosylase AlkZ-like
MTSIKRAPLTWSQVSAFRLRRHHLAGSRHADLAAIARDTCGIQAQVFSAAELSFSVRQPGIVRADIQAALWKKRTLVKTSCMRGTLHILAASDFPVYMSALRRRQVRMILQIITRYGVTEKEARDVMEASVETLAGGALTRRELTERVLSLGLVRKKAETWFRQSWWGVMRQALFEGLICYGPDRNREVTLVRVDQWLAKKREISEVDAQQVVLQRYLSAYGPATASDFSKWSGLSMPEANRAFASLEDELAEVEWEGRKAFIRRNDLDGLLGASLERVSVKLIPNFDTYLLGHKEKDHLVSPRNYKKVYRQAGWISAVVLAQGKVVGRWSLSRERDKTKIKITPFEKFTPSTRSGIDAEFERIKKFLAAS